MTEAMRVAVVGAGPSGLYAAAHILKQRGQYAEIDFFERLPTPWGLIRGGVAPDHPDKKLVVDRLFQSIFLNPQVRFFGNVEIGKDIFPADLSALYDATIYAIGASDDARLNIEGETLPGSWAAREFVGFYNGHPDFADLDFDLSTERAVIVGNGNVALDIARILAMPPSRLKRTDISERALCLLRSSAIREVVILGRRGVRQSAFHNPELEELERLDDTGISIQGDEIPEEPAACASFEDWALRRKMATLRRLADRSDAGSARRIVLRFLASSVKLLGNERVEAIEIADNHLRSDEVGGSQAHRSGETSVLSTGLVFRAIGYRGAPVPSLPFDEIDGIISNLHGRVVDDQAMPIAGIYVTGWIKRGCRGIIGSNKKCARETVDCLLDDLRNNRIKRLDVLPHGVEDILERRGVTAVSRRQWMAIDRKERDLGRSLGRTRVKMIDRPTMMDFVRNQHLATTE